MSEQEGPPLDCSRCGQRLVLELNADEVVTLGGRRMRFRRHTDFVICPRCFELYRIGDLRAGRIEPVSDEDLISAGEATPEDDD